MNTLRHTLIGVVLVYVLGCAGSPRVAPAPPHGEIAAIERVIHDALGAEEIPALSLVVMRGDEVAYARGIGWTGRTRGEAATPQTMYQLGSISKQFLAALVLLLGEDGTLALDDAVATHLPEFARDGPPVRIHHLLAHTSGLRELFQLPGVLAAFDDLSRTRVDLARTVLAAPIDFPPGSRWSYSNTNYTILALLVERLTGLPYEDALRERVFVPLGLASLRACPSLVDGPGQAHGHVRRAEDIIPAAPENMEWIRGDGGLCGNALDVARWTRLLGAGHVLTPASHTAMTRAVRLDDGALADYGFAMSLVEPDGVRKYAHNGAMAGFSASAAYYPEAELTIVVLTNLGDLRTEAIERPLARRMLGLPEPLRRAHALSATQRERVTGVYDIGVFDVHIVEREGDLRLETPRPGPTVALRALGDRDFVADAQPDALSVHFTGGGSPASSLRLYMGAMHWYGTRRP